MPWADFLLALTGGYAAYEFTKFAKGREGLKFLALASAACFFIFIEIAIIIGSFFTSSAVVTVIDFIVEWGQIISLSFILSSLVLLIRETRPSYEQFPLLYGALPFLIIISYFFALESELIRRWLFFIYQGGALVVGLLMYGSKVYQQKRYKMVLIGISGLFLAYLMYWTIPILRNNYPTSWKLVLLAGIVTTAYGYKSAVKK